MFERHFEAPEYEAMDVRARRSVSMKHAMFFVPWFMTSARPDDAAALMRKAPPPLKAIDRITRRRYARLMKRSLGVGTPRGGLAMSRTTETSVLPFHSNQLNTRKGNDMNSILSRPSTTRHRSAPPPALTVLAAGTMSVLAACGSDAAAVRPPIDWVATTERTSDTSAHRRPATQTTTRQPIQSATRPTA